MREQSNGPLLVVVDMQRVFDEESSPWFVPGFEGIVEPIRRLVGAFGDRVALTRFVVPEDPRGSWRDYYRAWDFARRSASRPLFDLAAPWADMHAPVVDKTTFSAFGPELVRLIGPSNQLVLCGVSTECCVLATALEAADAGVSVRIVADACASIDEETHAAALRVVAVGFSPLIAITSVDEELALCPWYTGETMASPSRESTSMNDQELIDKYIEPNPNRPGRAEARVAGYAVPVWALVGHLEAVHGDVAEVAHDYRLPREVVEAALAYYRRYKTFIDARLEANAG